MCSTLTVRVTTDAGVDDPDFNPIEWDGIEAGEHQSCACPLFSPDLWPEKVDALRADFWDKALLPALKATGWGNVVIEKR